MCRTSLFSTTDGVFTARCCYVRERRPGGQFLYIPTDSHVGRANSIQNAGALRDARSVHLPHGNVSRMLRGLLFDHIP